MNTHKAGLYLLLLFPMLGCGERLLGWPIVDDTPPTVIWTSPNAHAQEVALNSTLSVTFSEPMRAESMGRGVLHVQGGDIVWDGPVWAVGKESLHFIPPTDLQADTLYTATLSTQVKDLAGNPLAHPYVWTFRTVTERRSDGQDDTGEADDSGVTDDTGQPDWPLEPVKLRSLEHFVAVSGAGLTSSNSGGISLLNGDVGLSPSATCMGDGAPCTASNPVINGTLYAADAEGVAEKAKADLTLAYVDAQGRPPGTIVSDLAGRTLPPGVYTSNSSMSIAVDGVLVLDGQGDPNAVWIFQVGSSLTVGDNVQVLLTGGAQPENVFWAVFASSTLGTGVSFQGNIMAGASNSVGTGSVVVGRLLCTTGSITLLSNTITLPNLR